MRKLFLLLLLTGSLYAQVVPSQKVKIYLTHSGDDPVGNQVVFALKEAIRQSNGYELTQSISDLRPWKTIMLSIITLDDSSSHLGVSTAISIKGDAKSPGGCWLNTTHRLYDVGSLHATELGGQILASLDSDLDESKRLFSKSSTPAPPEASVKDRLVLFRDSRLRRLRLQSSRGGVAAGHRFRDSD